MLGGSFGGIQSYSEKQGNIKSYKKKRKFFVILPVSLENCTEKEIQKRIFIVWRNFRSHKEII